MADDLLRFFLHSVLDPFQDKTNKPEFEEVCYERSIFFTNIQVFCLTKLVCDIQHQLICQTVKIIVTEIAISFYSFFSVSKMYCSPTALCSAAA